jgi:TonB family protein
MIPSVANSEHWLWLLLDCTVKGSVVLLIAFLTTHALKRRSAALRHMIWAAAALCVLALPVLNHVLPVWHSGVYGKAASLLVAGPQNPAQETAGSLTPMVVGAAADTPWRSQVVQGLVLVWAGGFGAAVLVLLVGTARLIWIASRAEPLFIPQWMRLSAELSRAIGLKRPVRLLQDRGASMPVTWGVLRPRVLLPKGAEHWPAARMRVVLSHELAHIRRQDWLVQILAEVGRAMYWFNPLVWAGCKRLREESEYACDDAVLNSGIHAPDYAEHLLDLARRLRSSDRAWSVALAMARQSNLERRFIAMLNPSLNRRSITKKTAFLTALGALCLMLPLAALQAPVQSMSGKFFGTVYDASGGVIPNATVMVSNAEANTKDMTTTSAAGVFEFPGLPSGSCVLEVLKPGFQRFLMSNLVLKPNESLVQNVVLQIGKVSERIDVVAHSPLRQVAETSPLGTTQHRVRVGGNVQPPKLIKMVKPVYPPIVKNGGIEGAVLLEAVIGMDGSLMSLRVMNSQIDPDLAKAAVEAVSQWRYQPTLLNGVPVEVMTSITINFRLSE